MGASKTQLKMPEKQADGTGHFPARRASVRRWLRELPVANPVETSRQLYEGITDTNRRSLRPKQRLAVLNELHDYLRYSVEGLRPQYRDREIPLQGTPRKMATLSSRLLTEMARGYEIALDDIPRRGASKRRLALILVNALHYRGLGLVENWLAYENPADGTWQRVHALFQMALNHHATQQPVRPDWAPARLTPATCYKRLALTASSDPLQLDRGEVLDVWWLLGHWAHCAEISALGDDGGEVFRVPRDDDRPPHPSISELNRSDDRFLFTTPLIQRGQLELRRARRRWPWQQRPPVSRCPQLAQRLLIALAAVPARQNKRVQVSSRVQAVLGISQGHQALSQELGLPVVGSDTRERAFQAQDRNQTKRERDVWDVVHADGVAELLEQYSRDRHGTAQPSRPQDTDGSELPYHRWRLVDISPRGYCLLTHSEQSYRARVGELLVVREDVGSNRAWQLGVIRWLRSSSEGGLQLGVQILGAHPRPVMIRTQLSNGSYSPPERAFVLPGSNQSGTATSIITPWNHYPSGQTVTLRYGKLNGRITLGRCHEASNHFCHCEFEYAGPLGTDDELPQWLSGDPQSAAS